MGASQAALADIELARKEEEQKLIQAKTLLASASVEAGKTLALANTTADISVEKAVQQVTEAAKADMELAKVEREQALTKANTTLQTAMIQADVVQAAADTVADITEKRAEAMYESRKDKYTKIARWLKTAVQQNANMNEPALLTYFANYLVPFCLFSLSVSGVPSHFYAYPTCRTCCACAGDPAGYVGESANCDRCACSWQVGGRQQQRIAMESPAQSSYKADL